MHYVRDVSHSLPCLISTPQLCYSTERDAGVRRTATGSSCYGFATSSPSTAAGHGCLLEAGAAAFSLWDYSLLGRRKWVVKDVCRFLTWRKMLEKRRQIMPPASLWSSSTHLDKPAWISRCFLVINRPFEKSTLAKLSFACPQEDGVHGERHNVFGV